MIHTLFTLRNIVREYHTIALRKRKKNEGTEDVYNYFSLDKKEKINWFWQSSIIFVRYVWSMWSTNDLLEWSWTRLRIVHQFSTKEKSDFNYRIQSLIKLIINSYLSIFRKSNKLFINNFIKSYSLRVITLFASVHRGQDEHAFNFRGEQV